MPGRLINMVLRRGCRNTSENLAVTHPELQSVERAPRLNEPEASFFSLHSRAEQAQLGVSVMLRSMVCGENLGDSLFSNVIRTPSHRTHQWPPTTLAGQCCDPILARSGWLQRLDAVPIILCFCFCRWLFWTPHSPPEEYEQLHFPETKIRKHSVWLIGTNTFCKVKAWCEGLEPENDTIRIGARKAPCIPVPEVIYSWVDHDWNRSFLILKRVGGQTLRDSWPQLSLPQKSQIARQVAKYCSTLAGITSLTFESATGRGVLEPFLTGAAEPSHPSWKPRPLGPFSVGDLNSYLPRQSDTHRPDIGLSLHFYPAYLGPGNIMVSEKGSVEGILDWESAGFYPRCWIALKPMLSAGFYLSPTEGTKREEWRDLLGSTLKKEGFEPAISPEIKPKA